MHVAGAATTCEATCADAAAIRCYEKVGFRPVGVLRRDERGPDGTWHDGLLMDLLAEELQLAAEVGDEGVGVLDADLGG